MQGLDKPISKLSKTCDYRFERVLSDAAHSASKNIQASVKQRTRSETQPEMTTILKTLELSLEDFQLLREYIHEKSGMYFQDRKLYLLQSRLSKRMEELGITSFRDYFYTIKYDTSKAEFHQLMNLVTTNETYFFRNEPQLEAFRDATLPEIIARKKHSKGIKTLRIWSAGCSTGEEPYTIAMIIKDAIKNESGWHIEIIANDISESVLHAARKGEYAGQSLRHVSGDHLSRYFLKRGDAYTVLPEIKSMVKFVQLNLNDTGKLSMYNNLDVIFCRNVMIYFSDEVKKRIVKAFYQALLTNGLLIIGHSESLHGVSKSFKLKYFKGSLMYLKEGTAAAIADTDSVQEQEAAIRATAEGGASRAIKLLEKIRADRAAKQHVFSATDR